MDVASGVIWRCRMGCSNTNKKNKLQNPPVNREMNLLSLINPSIAHVSTVALMANHGLISLKTFVSQFPIKLCN